MMIFRKWLFLYVLFYVISAAWLQLPGSRASNVLQSLEDNILLVYAEKILVLDFSSGKTIRKYESEHILDSQLVGENILLIEENSESSMYITLIRQNDFQVINRTSFNPINKAIFLSRTALMGERYVFLVTSEDAELLDLDIWLLDTQDMSIVPWVLCYDLVYIQSSSIGIACLNEQVMGLDDIFSIEDLNYSVIYSPLVRVGTEYKSDLISGIIQWSLDETGTRVAYEEWFPDHIVLHTFDSVTQNSEILLETDSKITHISWSPDNKYLGIRLLHNEFQIWSVDRKDLIFTTENRLGQSMPPQFVWEDSTHGYIVSNEAATQQVSQISLIGERFHITESITVPFGVLQIFKVS
jgi:hypothetical protein